MTRQASCMSNACLYRAVRPYCEQSTQLVPLAHAGQEGGAACGPCGRRSALPRARRDVRHSVLHPSLHAQCRLRRVLHRRGTHLARSSTPSPTLRPPPPPASPCTLSPCAFKLPRAPAAVLARRRPRPCARARNNDRPALLRLPGTSLPPPPIRRRGGRARARDGRFTRPVRSRGSAAEPGRVR
jgi:hypothetical protein